MNTRRFSPVAMLLVAVLLCNVLTVNALTVPEALIIRKALNAVPVPELAAKAAELVTKADKTNQLSVAFETLRTSLIRSPTVGPSVVAAIARVVPNMAPAITVAAVQMAPKQVDEITRAACLAAPAKTELIISAMARALPESNASLYPAMHMSAPTGIPALHSRPGAAGVVGGGFIFSFKRPISSLPTTFTGGEFLPINSNMFPTNPPTPQPFTTPVKPRPIGYSGPIVVP